MPKTPKSKDPHAQREAENYANPIPSREFILQLLEQVGEPIGHLALCEQMKLTSEEQIEALRRRLIAMSRRRSASICSSEVNFICSHSARCPIGSPICSNS